MILWSNEQNGQNLKTNLYKFDKKPICLLFFYKFPFFFFDLKLLNPKQEKKQKIVKLKKLYYQKGLFIQR